MYACDGNYAPQATNRAQYTEGTDSGLGAITHPALSWILYAPPITPLGAAVQP